MDDTEVAVAAALAGADAVRRRYGGPLSRHAKSPTDFATEADLEAEAAIRAVIAEHRPDDAVLGEEAGLEGDAAAARRWLVDPLCGTLNFAAHTPLVGVNVALTVDGIVTAAAVADPFEPRVFTTSDDLRPTPLTRLVDVDFDLDPPWSARLVSSSAFTEAFATRVVSSSLAAVWVADGRRAGYVFGGEVRASVHFAAPVAVCRAAGCVVTDLAGYPLEHGGRGLVVAADDTTHATLLRAVAAAG